MNQLLSLVRKSCLSISMKQNFIAVASLLLGVQIAFALLAEEKRFSPMATTSDTSSSRTTRATLIQVQIIHRHGDRTPITPLKDVEYWQSTLPNQHILQRISKGIRLKRHPQQEGMVHDAQGKPPFGQLTSLGLLQMVQLGTKLREELSHDDDNVNHEKSIRQEHPQCKLFTADKPLHPQRIKVRSTDFPRTIQSLQALLVGLFPDESPSVTEDFSIEVDVRNSKYHIPDPQPRHTRQQERLERQLSFRRHILEKEEEMLPLAIKVTNELLSQNVLHEQDAQTVSSGFNVGGIHPDDQTVAAITTTVLPWAQLAEITKCLRVHNLLPSTITHEEQDLILQHASWKWFELLRHVNLSKLAMHHMMTDLLTNICEKVKNENDTLLHIYSAHDSTLIGLMCAFQLTQPAEWPDYASYLKIELIAVETDDNQDQQQSFQNDDDVSTTRKQHYVRFSLNGSLLRCKIGNAENAEPHEMVPLEILQEFIHDLSHLDDDDEHLETHIEEI